MNSHFEAYVTTKDKAIAKVESGFKQSRFIRPLPPSISKDKKFCQELHAAFVKNTIEAIKETFTNVEDSTKLEAKLGQLNIIINDQANKSGSSPAWRPSDDALTNQAAHDFPAVLAYKQKLQEEILAPLQNDVDELEKRVSSLSYEIAENASKINAIILDSQ